MGNSKMKALRGRIVALSVCAGIAAAAVPAAADGPGRDRYYYPAWQGLYAGAHLGYGDAGPADGFIGGAHVGYNWQKGQIVYGWEADVSLSDISESITLCNPAGCVSAEASIDWMASVRGRLGYLISPSFLAYGTVGLGIVSGSGSASISAPGVREGISVSDTETDIVLGIGVEGKLTETATARIEYLSFGDLEIDVIRAGVTFRFGN
jgi:opacity protein-like surface antigen